MTVNSDKIFTSFGNYEDIVNNIDSFELAIINSDLEPDCKVAINKLLTAIQTCDFYTK